MVHTEVRVIVIGVRDVQYLPPSLTEYALCFHGHQVSECSRLGFSTDLHTPLLHQPTFVTSPTGTMSGAMSVLRNRLHMAHRLTRLTYEGDYRTVYPQPSTSPRVPHIKSKHNSMIHRQTTLRKNQTCHPAQASSGSHPRL